MENRDILIVEDEAAMGRILSDTLSEAGYNVTLATDGISGLEIFTKQHPDLVIADIMMPCLDGLSMVERLREVDSSVEILFLSARSGAEDVVEGFRRGGNDYLRKPFSLEELLARVAALLARHPKNTGTASDVLRIGNYHLDHRRWTLTIRSTTHRLTAREAAILYQLAKHEGEVVESSELLINIWGDDGYYALRSLNVFISRLRSYLAEDKRVEIQSVRGAGYRLIVSNSVE